ncbi:SIS domain-containing protein [Fretibacter rubidus]|uniref:KpsF/GutQ family sugar-phosphate isomerase n=1 Tax=Fretibacter rubidus TaxID=570162 RepID=UPI00352B8D73
MMDHATIGQRVLATEIAALERLHAELGGPFNTVVDKLSALEGRIILAGVGKSGHVARKIAATLASTGSPSLYIHPTEASHGDMGMITSADAVIALSRSGETTELADLIAYCRRFSIPLIGMTAAKDSALGRASDYLLLLPDAEEACRETRAPTTSTTLQIALGDALSVALLEAKGFTAKDFKTYHPGGKLGATLATVAELMHTGDALPLTPSGTDMATALKVMSDKGFGCVGVVKDGTLIGMVTDGDIRRHLSDDIADQPIDAIMTRDPKTTTGERLAADALRDMTAGPNKIMQLFVLQDGAPIGLVHLHDFLRAGLI